MFCMALFGLSYFLIFKKRHSWILIALFLSTPSLVDSKPLNHFDTPLLSPIQKGEFLLAQSLNDEALQLYQSLINERAGGSYAFRGMVRAYKNMDRLEDAKAWVENYLANNKTSSPALYALGYVFFIRNDMKKAKVFFDRALKINTKNALALNNLGAILSYQRSYAQAVRKVKEAIYINPNEIMFFRNLEIIYKTMGDPGQIITDYKFYLKKGLPRLLEGYGVAAGRSIRQAGFRLYNEGKLDDAILKFMELVNIYKNIKHNPGLVPAYFSLGLLHEEKGDIQSAKQYFGEVLEFNPSHIEAKERYKNIK